MTSRDRFHETLRYGRPDQIKAQLFDLNGL